MFYPQSASPCSLSHDQPTFSVNLGEELHHAGHLIIISRMQKRQQLVLAFKNSDPDQQALMSKGCLENGYRMVFCDEQTGSFQSYPNVRHCLYHFAFWMERTGKLVDLMNQLPKPKSRSISVAIAELHTGMIV